MYPRQHRIAAFLCLALAALDVVVAQLPHSHHHAASSSCTSSACKHHYCVQVQTCSHSTCSHTRCSHSSQSEPARPIESEQPCNHCTLCRHQSQAALPVTIAPVSLLAVFCEWLPDRRDAQIASHVPQTYRGRGPPGVL